MSAKTQITFQIKGILGAFTYLAIGVAIYAINYGSVIPWSDAWFYLITVFWPIALIVWAIKWIIIFGVIGVVLWVAWYYWSKMWRYLHPTPRERELRAKRKALKQRNKKNA